MTRIRRSEDMAANTRVEAEDGQVFFRLGTFPNEIKWFLQHTSTPGAAGEATHTGQSVLVLTELSPSAAADMERSYQEFVDE